MPLSVASKVVRKIYGKGRGWSFSSKDFGGLGTRSAVDVALYRLHERGTIRRVLRGIYDYPRRSGRLARELAPDLDEVARALARKFGWRIQPTGPVALNLLGLSTQVMGRYAYFSDGPDRTYRVGRRTIEFRHTALKESGFKLRESSLVVQAIRSLGEERIEPGTIAKIRDALGPDRCSKVLKDARLARGWVHDVILRICRGER